jgi:hypothetical protein
MKVLRLVVSSVFLMAVSSIPTLAQDAIHRALSQIDWGAAKMAAAEASKADGNTISQFRASSPEGFDEVRLPVLIFGAGVGLGTPRFRGQGTAYAAVYAPEGAKLTIVGSSSTIVAPSGLIFEHEGTAFESIGDGADYSFTRFGAAYTLRLTCDEPLKDTRCTDPQYLSNAADTLIVVGGKLQ